MKKHFLTLILAFLVVVCSIFAFSSCGEETVSELTFNTLSVEGETVYGKVNNEITTFSFLNEIVEHGNASYRVYKEIGCETEIISKSISLNEGDNTVYILQTVGKTLKLYTVTIRRRPIYEVTFNTNGGAPVQSQMIEEDNLATEPETSKDGFDFAGWDYDFTVPITDNTVISASWLEGTETPYKVEYYLQNLENDDYTLQEDATEILTGTTDTLATAEIKTFEHFTPVEQSVTGNIDGDGQTVLKVYYLRNEYTVTFDGNGGTPVSGSISQTVKYGDSVYAPVFEKEGHTFTGFDKTDYTNISESFTVTAGWQVNQYTLTIVYSNGQADKVITQDYGTDIETIDTPEREYYEYLGWDKTMPTTMPAEDITITANWKSIFTLSGNTLKALTAYGKANYTEIVIPSSIDGVAVTGVGEEAFYYCTGLTSVTIPGSVTNIGGKAFYHCTGLTSVAILDGVTSIGEYAFYCCTGLTSITVPDSVTSIDSYAFYGCSGLTEITLPFVGETKYGTNNTYFGYIFGASNYTNNFAYLPDLLEKVTVTGGRIDVNAFYNCGDLTSITIGDGVTSISENAFWWCDDLTSITVSPNNAAYQSIDGNLYSKDGRVLIQYAIGKTAPSFAIPQGVTDIGYGAFNHCNGLTSVTMQNGVTSIAENAFYDCCYLKNITIPDSVTYIGSGAFYGCCFNELTLPFVGETKNGTSNTHLGYIFGATEYSSASDYMPTSLREITVTGGAIGNNAFYGCSSLDSITIPDGIISIGDNAFYGCSSLSSIKIPDSVRSIGGFAFYGCSNLTEMTLPFVGASDDSSGYKKVFGYIFGHTKTTSTSAVSDATYQYVDAYGTGYYHYYIPTSIKTVTITLATKISENAFRGCSSLTSITIPDSVTYIGSGAFYGCSSLAEMTLPFVGETKEGRNNTSIGFIFGDMFSIPNSLKKVTVTLATSLGDSAFRLCSGLTSVTLPDSVTSIGSSAFNQCTGLTSITIPGKVTSIGSNAFSYCSSLTSITIPDSVTSIGSSAFRGCDNLREITLPFVGASKDSTDYDSVFGYIFGHTMTTSSSAVSGAIYQFSGSDYSGTYYFHYYVPSSIKKVTVTGGELNANAFYNCTGLTSITVGDGVTGIGSHAFHGCVALTSVKIGKGVTYIGSNAFKGCTGLKKITVPDNVNYIGSAAFSGCRNLEEMTLPFVGESRKTASDSWQYPFGYIFGTSSYSGGQSTLQNYIEVNLVSKAYYIPTYLRTVTITGGEILRGAFDGCSGLSSVTIGDGVTGIGWGAFYGCTGSLNITIPDSVTSIDNYAFYNCSLLRINYRGTEEQWAAISLGSDWNHNANYTITYNYTEE